MARALAVLLFFIISGLVISASQEGAETIEIVLQTGSSWDGAPLPDYLEGTPEITILRVIIPPGQQIAIHKHSIINAVVVISGELSLELESGEQLIVNAGEAVAEVIEKWHGGMGTGNEPAVLLVFYAGIEGVPLSVRK
ncbi:MAG: cupin domain-containing protein [Gammaproteobacteria bacterium]|jgi:quercetin dioxygenase-like cupin family protein|nr:cupin domain-containing protein [Gammaproteobacteria bacterium]